MSYGVDHKNFNLELNTMEILNSLLKCKNVSHLFHNHILHGNVLDVFIHRVDRFLQYRKTAFLKVLTVHWKLSDLSDEDHYL